MRSKKILTLLTLFTLVFVTKILVSEPEMALSDNVQTINYADSYSSKAYSRHDGVGFNRQLKRKNIREIYIRKPVKVVKPIEIIKPIEKKPVNEVADSSEITLNTDSAVNDPGYKYQWAISATNANKAWSLVDQKREVKVAVLDTGVDYTHIDLKNRVLTDLGYNFINNSKDVMDDNGHGTHVSGIIAAEANNNQGITGIVGSLDVKLIPVKVLDKDGIGEEDKIAEGIRYAADKGADIINLSFGSIDESEEILSALQYAKEKGIFIVAASGNDNSNANLYLPAGYDEGVYTVSAVTPQYKKASFSNYGTSIDAAAPGVKIISTVPNGYAVWDGTSMAAPLVSGVAAIVKAQNPSLTPDEITEILDSTATDIFTRGKDLQSGYGIINAYKAVSKVTSSL
ncbi:S8 family peptidase [Clostridium sp. BSD9I1]|uniref:S8 family peptidase n=1 Tax=Clostridium sp. BSD9I1 TaxID=2003589 RepID=UPI001FA84D1A|nr:S8 family peptidase [Clostridium sp. BSD9I1]